MVYHLIRVHDIIIYSTWIWQWSNHRQYYQYDMIFPQVLNDHSLSSVLGGQAEWVCWQTGMELHYAHTTLFRMREVLPVHSYGPSHGSHTPTHGPNHPSVQPNHIIYDYKSMRFLVRQEGVWSDVEVRIFCHLFWLLCFHAVRYFLLYCYWYRTFYSLPYMPSYKSIWHTRQKKFYAKNFSSGLYLLYKPTLKHRIIGSLNLL